MTTAVVTGAGSALPATIDQDAVWEGYFARHYEGVRAARLLKQAPALAAWRPWLKGMALSNLLPASARAFSLRLYRAALYAEAV